MNNSKGQFSFRLIQRCPVCNQEYSLGKIQILDEENNNFLAYLTCANCQSSILVRVMTLPQGLVGNAILTDLTSDEVLEFSEAETVKGDEVLEVHRYLMNHEDFIQKLKSN